MNNINNLYYQPFSLLIAIITNVFLFYLKENILEVNNIFNTYYILIIFINAIFMNMLLIDDNKYTIYSKQDLNLYQDIIDKCNINNQQKVEKNYEPNNDNSLSSFHINILLIIYIFIISSLLYLYIKNNITFNIFNSKFDNYIPIIIFWLLNWIYIFIIKKIFKS